MEPRLKDIEAITNFIFINDIPVKADLIIVPGSSHSQLPKKAVYLYKKGLSKKILFTGGFNPKISQNECCYGKDIALASGIPQKDICCECISSNTKENALESHKIVEKYKLAHKTIFLVCKPYHARRLKMTFSKIFSKSYLLMIPTKDERNITRNNWWKDKDKTVKVMEEIGKIGEYFLKGDLSL